MAKIYSYPRVNITTKALQHSSVVPEADDTTVLFVPFIANKGPAKEIVRVHSLEEFINKFGLDTKRMTLTALNIANWLTNGGTIYAYRMLGSNESTKKATATESGCTVEAKYYGTDANGLVVKLNHAVDSTSVRVDVYRNNKAIESFSAKFDTTINVENLSEYISKITMPETALVDVKLTLADGTDGIDSEAAALTAFWTKGSGDAYKVLANPLDTPIELIMDAGYSKDIKALMAEFVYSDPLGENDGLRPDIRCILEKFIYGSTEAADFSGENGIDKNKCSNLVVYSAQRLAISEETFFGKDMEVGSTYFLSQLIPANDKLYGLQFPTAGKRRGVLEGVKAISSNPTPEEKEAMFNERVNYIEKESRGYYFMSQRTYDGSTADNYNALSFLNNSLVVCRMVHELESLGRDYLFEFNDSLTLSNMQSVLNKYVTNWISNRTLSFGNVVVSKNQYSDEAVDVQLNIKFTGTIETISIDITIE